MVVDFTRVGGSEKNRSINTAAGTFYSPSSPSLSVSNSLSIVSSASSVSSFSSSQTVSSSEPSSAFAIPQDLNDLSGAINPGQHHSFARCSLLSRWGIRERAFYHPCFIQHSGFGFKRLVYALV